MQCRICLVLRHIAINKLLMHQYLSETVTSALDHTQLFLSHIEKKRANYEFGWSLVLSIVNGIHRNYMDTYTRWHDLETSSLCTYIPRLCTSERAHRWSFQVQSPVRCYQFPTGHFGYASSVDFSSTVCVTHNMIVYFTDYSFSDNSEEYTNSLYTVIPPPLFYLIKTADQPAYKFYGKYDF